MNTVKTTTFVHGLIIMTCMILSVLLNFESSSTDWIFLAVVLGFGTFSLIPSFIMLEKKKVLSQLLIAIFLVVTINSAVFAAEDGGDITDAFITAQVCGNGSVVLDEKFQKDEQLYYSCLKEVMVNHNKLGIKTVHSLCTEYKALRPDESQLCEFAFKNFK